MATAQISHWANLKDFHKKCEQTKMFSLTVAIEPQRALTQGGLQPHVAEVSSWQTNETALVCTAGT